MNTTELITAVRRHAFLSDFSPAYTDAVIISALNEQLLGMFFQIVGSVRQEYGVHYTDVTATVGVSEYRVPNRAVVNGLREVFVSADSGVSWNPVELLPVERADLAYDSNDSGTPYACMLRGDSLKLFPKPATAVTIRMYYVLRPPALKVVSTQGLISAKTTTTVTVGVAVTGLSSGARADVVHPNGGFELAVVDRTVTVAGTTYTFAAGTDLSRVEVGDYVRIADTTDWPMLPVELHDALAQTTAAVILSEQGDVEKAGLCAGKASDTIKRVQDAMSPRIKGKPPVFVNRNGLLRNGGSRARSWR